MKPQSKHLQTTDLGLKFRLFHSSSLSWRPMLGTGTQPPISPALVLVCSKWSGLREGLSIRGLFPLTRSPPLPTSEPPPSGDGKGVCSAPGASPASTGFAPLGRQNPEHHPPGKPASPSRPPFQDKSTGLTHVRANPRPSPGAHHHPSSHPFSLTVLQRHVPRSVSHFLP